MKRPHLINFTAIESNQQISIRTSISMSGNAFSRPFQASSSQFVPTTPIASIGLIRGSAFRIKIVAKSQQNIAFIKEIDSDNFGNFFFKVPLPNNTSIDSLQVYEIKFHTGVELLLGSFIPYKINDPKKLVISDFDKTLCETTYSTPKEMYLSVTKPLEYYPPIENSITRMRDYIADGFQPFILSASPHFYGAAIRDWLYQNKLYISDIFLKDYRRFFSFSQNDLYKKDFKAQGFYKLNQLVDILLMTGIPDELILMGDGFESDPLVYLTLSSILSEKLDPWLVWNTIKKEKEFKLNKKQDVKFLNKYYQLSSLSDHKKPTKIKIDIRCRKNSIDEISNKKFPFKFVEKQINQLDYYVG